MVYFGKVATPGELVEAIQGLDRYRLEEGVRVIIVPRHRCTISDDWQKGQNSAVIDAQTMTSKQIATALAPIIHGLRQRDNFGNRSLPMVGCHCQPGNFFDNDILSV